MRISDRAEEIMETLWVHTEEEKEEPIGLGIAKGEPAIEELWKSGHIKLIRDKIVLTEKGTSEGRKVVRRHRLAERLFADILDVKKKLVHPLSCEFEHLLHDGTEDNICILLGHPKTCPHGRAIPDGECCRKFKESVGKAVSPLDRLQVNQRGRVAYIQTRDNKALQKLMAMGILPGIPITLIQKFPSFVFQAGQSQFAVDADLASCVYIRL
ncbi:MAG: DtxR family iron (metal) dependent repressor [Omnitrophica WOR_2 bacterium RIFCSPLOWO2_12_FULL_51_8]|nr:MAG: DtxR family iron (metal) dependent repressor [Omnitrophica WOR_2 bacterium RIFCSPLOWO2_12_FULL_51_8]